MNSRQVAVDDTWSFGESASVEARRWRALLDDTFPPYDVDDIPDSRSSVHSCEQLSKASAPQNEPADIDRERPSIRHGYREGPVGEEWGGFAGEVEIATDATEALRRAVGRSPERRRKVDGLLQEGEAGHAKRLAACRRQSVQLECPELAGGCGHDGNYVPMTCGSRLCPECMNDRIGQLIEKYRSPVGGMGDPVFMTLTQPNVSDPVVGLERLQERFRRFRQRVIPPNGDGWSWDIREGSGSDPWKAQLQAGGHHDLVRRWQKRYVRPAEHTVEDCSTCDTIRERCPDAGTHGHRVEECPDCSTRKVRCDLAGERCGGIPVEEAMRGGIYAVDIKQQESGRWHVHLHVIADVPYLPQAALASVWDDCGGGEVADIRRPDVRGEETRDKVLAELVGYAAKVPEYETLQDEIDVTLALKGSRLVQPFGSLHGNIQEVRGLLRCAECDRAPAFWEYLGVVEGNHANMQVGSAPDGDRPPPGGET